MKKTWFLLLIWVPLAGIAQNKKELYKGIWRAQLHRQDSQLVVFNLESLKIKGKWQFKIRNDKERIEVKKVIVTDDSVNFDMPTFESSFRTKIQPDGSLKGVWFKGTALQTQRWIFTAIPNQPIRFDAVQGKHKNNVTGRWAVTITRANGGTRPAVAEFSQKDDYLSGTFLTPSGDYRFLEGTVSGNLLRLSVFDGAHAYSFIARIDSDQQISNGVFYSGFNGRETWAAYKDASAKVPDVGNTPLLKEGEDRLRFSFKDVDRKMVSSDDERFKNKVVIIQLMGSWCPNCLDETKFLNDFYIKNKHRGVEVIALGYEYSTDFERSRIGLEKFRNLYNVQYPMLVTGVWLNDSLRTEKTLPQITPIKVFPTTIYIGKDGKVKKIEVGFYGPGTGIHHETYKKQFYARVEELLKGGEGSSIVE